LIGFNAGFPFFARNSVLEIFVDPWNEVTRERNTKMFLWQSTALLQGQNTTVDVQNRRGGIIQQWLDTVIDKAELGKQFAHVLGAAPRSRLVGHGGHPFDGVVLKQATQRHEHAANRTVAAYIRAYAFTQTIVDDLTVDRV